jgi:ABC-type transport system involved in cytochrome bd biosynthesis fused ATPase/permease subunit
MRSKSGDLEEKINASIRRTPWSFVNADLVEVRAEDGSVSICELIGLIRENLENGTGATFQVGGPNGAGKSALLQGLFEMFGKDDAIYVPASSTTDVTGAYADGRRSTGQRVKDHLDEALESPRPLLLLDEWDANIDAEGLYRAAMKRSNKIIVEAKPTQLAAEDEPTTSPESAPESPEPRYNLRSQNR